MKTFFECLPCFVRQCLDAGKMIGADDNMQERMLRAVFRRLAVVDLSKTPPEMGAEVQRIVRRESGVNDPYAKVKEEYNSLALEQYERTKKKIEDAKDPFDIAVRIAIAGNIIDFGVGSHHDGIDVAASLDEAVGAELEGDDLERMREVVGRAKNILYIGDNTGEIVFDRMFIEYLGPERITFAVRGAPVINDVTREDAERVGMTKIVKVIDNGTDSPGTPLHECSEEFKKIFDDADMVIAKGQGNYETLSECGKENLFFLLRVKCPVIARDVGLPLGSVAVKAAKSSVGCA